MVYEWMRLAQDIAGGKIITLPSEDDLGAREMGDIITGYFAGKDGVDVKNILKMLRLVESMSVGAGLPEAMHGAGSPAAQKIIIARRSGIEDKSSLAETIVGIRRDETFEKIVGKSEKDYMDEAAEKLRSEKVKICRRVTT